jgi:hypothetical protein
LAGRSTHADSVAEIASTAFHPATIRATARRREIGNAMPPVPREVQQNKDLFGISNQLRYVGLLGFHFQDERKVRKTSISSIVSLVFPPVTPIVMRVREFE